MTIKKFKITNIDTGDDIPLDIGKFPGGEIRVRLNINEPPNTVRIFAHLHNSDDVMTLVMLNDAVRRTGVRKVRLTMPYIPYARQDRVCNTGEAFSIKAFADLINSLKFSSVVVWDAHSIISTALINRCLNVPRYQLMLDHNELMSDLKSLKETYPVYLLSPDKGAYQKTLETVKAMPGIFDGIITSDKERDLATGKIIRTNVSNVPNDTKFNVLIADDICDGGRTFIEIAKVIEPYKPESINLFVTHGIFSQGMEVLLNKKSQPEQEIGMYFQEHTGLFDKVYSAIDFKDYR